MKVSNEVAAISKEINSWMKTLEKDDRPRIQAAEVALLTHYVRTLKAGEVFVEIGTGWGGSAAILAKVKPEDTLLFTIDNGSNFRRFGPRDGTEYKEFIEARFLMYGVLGNLEWVLGDSRSLAWEWPINILFVDGVHTYEGVRGDIENMVPHVVPGGVVIFHDYHMEGVKRAVDEFLEEEDLVVENRGGATVAVRKGMKFTESPPISGMKTKRYYYSVGVLP